MCALFPANTVHTGVTDRLMVFCTRQILLPLHSRSTGFRWDMNALSAFMFGRSAQAVERDNPPVTAAARIVSYSTVQLDALQRREVCFVLWHPKLICRKFQFSNGHFVSWHFRLVWSYVTLPCLVTTAGFIIVWGETPTLYRNGKPWAQQKDLTGTGEAAGKQPVRWLRRAR